jgi:hypothetical protein
MPRRRFFLTTVVNGKKTTGIGGNAKQRNDLRDASWPLGHGDCAEKC